MAVSTSIQISCDYPGCKRGQAGPLVVEWISEQVQKGAPLPEAAKEFVTFDLNGTKVAFCNRLHAALFFLPDGYETPVLKKVIDFPDNGNYLQAFQAK